MLPIIPCGSCILGPPDRRASQLVCGYAHITTISKKYNLSHKTRTPQGRAVRYAATATLAFRRTYSAGLICWRCHRAVALILRALPCANFRRPVGAGLLMCAIHWALPNAKTIRPFGALGRRRCYWVRAITKLCLVSPFQGETHHPWRTAPAVRVT